jgi:hypothetical protein
MMFYQKLKYRLYLVPLLAAAPFYEEFLNGAWGILSFLGYFLWFCALVILRTPDGQMLRNAFASLFSKDVLFFFMGGIAYFFLYRLCLSVLAQFALPVTEWKDRRNASKRLLLFTQGKHGPAIFVKGGQKTNRQDELDSTKPGVALVDSSSAVALVQHDDVKAMSLPSEDEWRAAHNKPAKKGKSPIYEPKEPEIKGPGVVFTENGQKIDETVDLRKQTRTSEFLEVYTRTGIKVKSKVTVIFSVSEPPETLLVGYLNGKQPTDLRILKVTQTETEMTIKGGVALDVDDAIEILRASLPMPETPPSNLLVPYPFDPERVKWAVFNQARDRDGNLVPWHRAPLEAASDIFRRMMSDVFYENFFSNDLLNLNRRAIDEEKTEENSPQQFISDLKDDFALRVKARGMMTFQFIEHLNGESFSPNQNVRLDALRRQTPVTLIREKFNFFRHMGIVVKSATFSDVQASDVEVSKRMLAAWKARMEREIAVFNAEYELEAIRVRNRNRALVQEEMTHLLTGIFKSTPHFDEALALRVLQALETSVADKEMPISDLNELLKNLYDWLLVDQKSNKDNGNPPEKSE